ncbi:MAG: class II aldolase/adducin family protein [Candidatus Korarchaeota archaeon]|nr:class II aldolase/adducin family protein [Candidatus Korarchaeota archaeon]
MDRTGRASELAEVMKLAYVRGYTTGAGGNASARVDEGILITPSGEFKGRLRAEDIILIDHRGRVLGGKGRPSSEWKLHLKVYEIRSDVGAILHCHHAVVTGLAMSMVSSKIDEEVLAPLRESDWTEEARIMLRDVKILPWRPYGTEELAEIVSNALKDVNAVVVLRHGAFVVSKDPWLALSAMDSLVEVFTINLVRRLVG